MQLKEIARALSATVAGDETLEIDRITHPADAVGSRDLAVALAAEAIDHLGNSRAKAALVEEAAVIDVPDLTLIKVAGQERMILATLTGLFDPGPAVSEGIHANADIAEDAEIGVGTRVGPLTAVGPRTRIGGRGVIAANVTVGADVTIGEGCLIHPGVVIGDRTVIGDCVIIQANTVIGSDGFGFIPVRNPDGSPGAEGRPKRIHSLGRVVIGDDVEIGAGTTIDRATLRETRIGSGTKIDNQVQIAHNATIGQSCLICGMAGIAGSVVIGDRAIVAAGAAIADHLTIGENATVTAGAAVAANVAPGGIVSGQPAAPHDVTVERYLNVGRLRTLLPKVENLRKQVEALEKAAKAE
jgi:UDP-3-O-[3-hydroxymyristoyl] glucosamine N-acyltransferase